MKTAEDAWLESFGNYPTDEDFAWPFFRDAFYAGREMVRDESEANITGRRTFYDVCRSKLLLGQSICDDIILELNKWIPEAATNECDNKSTYSKEWIDGYNIGKNETISKIKENL